jgi:hypothetical protein
MSVTMRRRDEKTIYPGGDQRFVIACGLFVAPGPSPNALFQGDGTTVFGCQRAKANSIRNRILAEEVRDVS